MQIRRLIALIIATVFLVACTGSADTKDNAEFRTFTDEIFYAEATADSLNLNYLLKNLSELPADSLPHGLSSFSYADLEKQSISYENLQASLSTFEKEDLSFQQQILYDILTYTLHSHMEGQTYIDFTEIMGPTTGIQAQLPVLLAEFCIEDATDLEQYYAILHSLPSYFNALLSLEKHKQTTGTLPCRSTLKHIISQCDNYLSKSGLSFLEKTFENRIQNSTFLFADEKTAACQKNKNLLAKKVRPAYQNLIDGLQKLLPDAPKKGNLSSYPKGKDYYRYLVRQTTGSSRPLGDIAALMKSSLDEAQNNLLQTATEDPSLFSSCYDYLSHYQSPEEILTTLQKEITKDFPDIPEINYEIKSVDDALEDYLSPAFYLTPPVDNCENHVIYINHSSAYDPSSLFNTLAHEGYPGHLYQACYLNQNNVPLLRHLLDFGGYTEGWATYAEIYSYQYTGGSAKEVQILQNNMIATLCLYGLCDIGIHHDGWTKKELLSFLSRYGAWDSDSATSLYEAIIDEPASYLKYTVGYLEIGELKKEFLEQAKENYSEKLFHTYLLEIGPAPFSILSAYVPVWLERTL